MSMLKTEAEILVSEASDLLVKAMHEDETPETLANKSPEKAKMEQELWSVIVKLGEYTIKVSEALDKIDSIEDKLDLLYERSKKWEPKKGDEA